MSPGYFRCEKVTQLRQVAKDAGYDGEELQTYSMSITNRERLSERELAYIDSGLRKKELTPRHGTSGRKVLLRISVSNLTTSCSLEDIFCDEPIT